MRQSHNAATLDLFSLTLIVHALSGRGNGGCVMGFLPQGHAGDVACNDRPRRIVVVAAGHGGQILHHVVDKSGSKTFQAALAKYLKRLNHVGKAAIVKKVKAQRSDSNNLLQLADYLAGIVSRKVQEKKNAGEYRRFNAHKEIQIQKWP